jgi:hypothetical protein
MFSNDDSFEKPSKFHTAEVSMETGGIMILLISWVFVMQMMLMLMQV